MSRRSVSIGTEASAGPSAAISAARASSAARAPLRGGRQRGVTPVASTTVSASTASTAEARKAARTRIISLVCIVLLCAEAIAKSRAVDLASIDAGPLWPTFEWINPLLGAVVIGLSALSVFRFFALRAKKRKTKGRYSTAANDQIWVTA